MPAHGSDDYDDEHVHYSAYVKPYGYCTARKINVRVSSEIKQVTCAGCLRQYIADMPTQTGSGYFER